LAICLEAGILLIMDQNIDINEELFKSVKDKSPDGFFFLEPIKNDKNQITDFRFTYINSAAIKFFNISSNDLINRNLLDSLPHHKELFNVCKEVSEMDEPRDVELKYSFNNSVKWFRYLIIKIKDSVAVSLSNITLSKLKQTETEARNNELNNIVARINDAFIALDKQWNLTYLNRSAMRIMNVDDSIIGKNLWEMFPMYKNTPVQQKFYKAMAEQQPVTFELEGILTPRWYRLSLFPSPEGISIYGIDITLSKAYEDQLLSTLRQKETLLREIHHRIKNNLQIIISILNLQSYYIHDPDALEIFRQSQNRIRSMSLIHEKLYKTDDLSSIDLKSYVADVVKYLSENYPLSNEKVNIIFDMEDIKLDSNTAISFGLILNELISNCLKYAFPSDNKGTVELRAKKNDSKLYFEISDNGVGLPENLNVNESNTLGLQLVNTLISQLNGEMRVESKKGTRFRIKIPYSR
jgi:two-component sensor histidine kinase/PAS domain-containing protein